MPPDFDRLFQLCLRLDSVPSYGVYTGGVKAPRLAAERLTISRLAQLGGVNLETIRYYERQGLLPAPPRTTSGYRVFPEESVQRLRFIKRAQELGFSLQEIRELLQLRITPGAKQADMRRRTEAKLADIEPKIQTIEAMKRALRRLTERCGGCGPLYDCPILESLDSLEAIER